ncbi:MAG: hypothetical protein P1U68_18000 [Verrucomicrobiales bacterium]|nr:hypothetical protein [Verrucomicrobiales bacterium]
MIFLALFRFDGAAFDPANQDDSLSLVRHFQPRSRPLGPGFHEAGFEPVQGETISLMGGTEVFQMQDSGHFERSLHRNFPEHSLKVRNLGWPADTVFRQQRPMYFYTDVGDSQQGSIPDSRKKVTPGTFILQFGKMESLDGIEALESFTTSYGKLLTELLKISGRIILVQPSPFPEDGPAGSLAAERNSVLEDYREAIRKLATKHRVISVESFDDLSARVDSDTEGSSLQRAILRKNKLWDQYYRPTNWAFLFGDRQHVPSSRDHRDANRRWFVEEIEKIPPLIAAEEAVIRDLAKGGENE